MTSDAATDPGQTRVRLLADSQLLDPDADLTRLEGLCRVAAGHAGVAAAAIDIQLAEGEWRTVAGPRDRAGMHSWDLPLTSAAGLEIGRLVLLDPAQGTLSTRQASAEVLQGLEALGGAVVAIVEVEAADTRVFEADEEAARAEAELSRVAGQISHDLNNPLAALAMSLEIALDHAEDLPPLLTSLLERASGSASRMKRMTADLLAYAQVPTPGAADLEREAESVLTGLADLLPGEVRLHDPLPRVALSPADARVVLVALLENAVKFAQDGVPLQVDLRAEKQDDDRWLVLCEDRGRGIPAADSARVFSPMVRLDKRVPGLGLGLATVERIVAAAGGEVGVAQRDGGGACVWFTVPAPPEAGAAL